MLLVADEQPVALAARPGAAAGSWAFERMSEWVHDLGAYIRAADGAGAAFEAANWIVSRGNRERSWLAGPSGSRYLVELNLFGRKLAPEAPNDPNDSPPVTRQIYGADLTAAERVIDKIKNLVTGSTKEICERDFRLLIMLANHKSQRDVGAKLHMDQKHVRDRRDLQWREIRKELVADGVIAELSAAKGEGVKKARKH